MKPNTLINILKCRKVKFTKAELQAAREKLQEEEKKRLEEYIERETLTRKLEGK